ncbi:MAG: MBL fold metallo-hydrolase [Vicinamibacterales bacterium]
MAVLGVLIATGVLSMTLAAYQQPPAPMVVEVDKVKDNLYVLKGGGGNSAVFIGADGVTVVDTKNPGWGKPLLAKIQTLTSKPVVRIINTHTHGDHVSGNVDFPASVDIVAHVNTKAGMENMKPVTGLAAPAPGPSIFQQNGGRGIAKRTFTDRMTIGNGADEIDLYYFGRAHTNGDAWVVFKALRVLHAGDAFHTKDLPIMDANNGGSGVDFPGTLLKAYNGIKDIDIVINGHNPTTTTMADLKMQSDFIGEFVTFVQAAKKSGKTVDDVVATWKTPAKIHRVRHTGCRAREVGCPGDLGRDEVKKEGGGRRAGIRTEVGGRGSGRRSEIKGRIRGWTSVRGFPRPIQPTSPT